jgi:hypothetical protein
MGIGIRVDTETMEWGFKIGRLAFTHRVSGPIQLVQAGCFFELWMPIGLGLYWRKRSRLVLVDKD